MFPKECFICDKYRIQRSKKNEFPRAIQTYDAEFKIKELSKDRLPEFHFKIKNDDLIARELKVHDSCYRKFTANEIKEPSSSKFKPQSELQEQGDFSNVQQYIDEHVLKQEHAVSMCVLQTCYGIGSGDTRYRHKLKQRLIKTYQDKLKFLSVGRNEPEIVVSAKISPESISFKDKTGCILKAAEYIKNDVNGYCQAFPDTKWPPDVNELLEIEKDKPKSLTTFLEKVLQTSESNITESTSKLVNSFSADIISAVGKGKIITAKQLLLALGIHNMTGK